MELAIKAGNVTRDVVILERSGGGRIQTRAHVKETGPCIEAANIHVQVSVRRNGKDAGTHTWCYFREAYVEIQ